SVDFTSSRMPRGQEQIIIQTFMVHHLGMSLLSLAYVLLDQPMQKRFEAEPQFQATLLLLQEQIPRVTNYYSAVTHTNEIAVSMAIPEMRVIKTAHTPIPEVQLLSNGSYHVMLTNSGGGYSRWKESAVTRWREDATCDNWGTFCYIRDTKSNKFWSNTYHPTMVEAKTYEAIFSQGRGEFKRIDEGLETHTEIIVSPEDDVEIRRVQISNRSGERREIDITSYAEVVLANPAADAAHPAFSNLFVQTELVETHQAIMCTRRPRSSEEHQPWMFHLVKVNNKKALTVSYETDRSRFVGRGNTVSLPRVMQENGPLGNSHGSVLDPIVSMRYTITLEEDDSVTLDMMLGVTETKEDCKTLIDKYQDRHLRDRAFELSWTHSQVTLRQINASEADAQLFGRMAGSVIYANPHFRAEQELLLKNHRGQSALWSYSISGDLPIVLLQITSTENMDLVKQLIQARAYWQLKGLSVDLFIWNEDESGYRQVLQDQIQSLIAAGTNFNTTGKQGGIFVRPVDQISNEDRILLQTIARVIISDKKGSLADQLKKKIPIANITPYLTPAQSVTAAPETINEYPERVFNNGLGGFSPEGHEYIIVSGEKSTPAPWVNIIANKNFGSVVSERGSAYTWFENAHSYRLTPWHNDPVQDTGGEAFYIRDERSGHFWSPSPYPAKGVGAYVTKHGFGYSVFEHKETGISSDMEIFVDTEAAVKFIIINIHNESGKDRKLSATGFVQWVLGDLPPKSAMHISTQLDAGTGALIAGNPYNTEFASKVCFFDTDDNGKTFTGSRTEFIGRNGSLQHPDAMKRVRLSGKTGTGFDSCAALQVVFELGPDERKQLIFRLGAANNIGEARSMIHQFKGATPALDALDKVHQLWATLLHRVRVETPDAAFNYMANGWLMYQTIACRLWGRSGFYQSGGAYGFRDQLQDTLAALHADASLTRDQVLLAASRQFKEGDAQHWWHPPLGRGVRTHCSDDYLWLPFVASKYIQHTNDTGVLDEIVGFLEGRPVNQNEESYYDLPGTSPDKATLYEHCKLAVQHGFRYGVHGLPLIGAGDWNDGMNMVGKDGKGESVWLAFFLYDVLQKFIPVARLKGDDAFAAECEKQASEIKANINKNAWDGNWYLRAFFDDGTPIGSSENEECKIDSISQSWSVLSGAGEPERSAQGMQSLEKHLVRRDAQLIQLLNPPFDKSAIDPGYIKGYVPGVRENGGQYTHAAVWTVMAFAKMKEKEKTWDLLRMLSPVNHGIDANAVATYKVEPYVMAADVYGVAPHTSRGGWTWYTGSAGWYYQLMIESFIGLKVENDELSFEPCLPAHWSELTIHYRYKDTPYKILLQRGASQSNEKIRLVDDKTEHSLTVYFN
ncbi:MAG: cyclic beta 1-2 glucan synthetase, partial [Chitinophagaceae bacterium]